MKALLIINLCIGVIFFLCYGYQLFYLILAYLKGIKKYPDAPPARIAVLTSARNEESVIRNLIDSILGQDYPKERFDMFVVADNCTDKTAAVAKEAGATVYERFNTEERGKGYALHYLIKKIEADYGPEYYDAYIVFDADNTAEPTYLSEMNRAFSAGYDVVTSYRNASNYDANWRSAGQGMYFLRDARVLNLARTYLGCNNYVTGTGFLFSSALCRRYGGWPFHTLTEDGEFTMHNEINRVKCAYCHDAIFYDEQAVDFKTSWNQQRRWCGGGLQIFRIYLSRLIKAVFSKRFLSAFDTISSLASAYFISTLAVVINVVASVILLALGTPPLDLLSVIIPGVLFAYFALTLFSTAITISDWHRIRGSAAKKIFYIFTFPLFLFSFIPPALVTLVKPAQWKTIQHGKSQNEHEKNKSEIK